MEQVKVGYFGSSTGAAAALIGAAERPETVHAFKEPGTLEQVAELAQQWFKKHLA